MIKTLRPTCTVLGLAASFAWATFAGYQSLSSTPLASSARQDDDSDQDQVMQMDDLPAAVRAAINTAVVRHSITGIKAEEAFGSTVYQAGWMVGDREYEIVVAEDGTVVELEEVIAMGDAPRAVRSAAPKHFPRGAEIVVEKKTIVVYSLEAEVRGKQIEVLLSATGQPIEIEAGGEHEHGDDDGDDDDGDDDDGDDDDGDDDDGDDDDDDDDERI